ncbi:hypothetical protein CHUAL_012402 [Chamberlinius hualienensis]
MDGPHVTILAEKDAEEWSKYVTACFSHILDELSKSEWNIVTQLLSEIELPLTSVKIGKFKRSKLQVIILSPKFLDYVAKHPSVVFGQLFDPLKIICLHCGVMREDVAANHRASLASYDSWCKITVVDNDLDFAPTLFTRTKNLLQNDTILESLNESVRFKLNPSKVREGLSKVTIELLDPTAISDKVTVHIETDSNETILLDAKQCNPYTLKVNIPGRFFGVSQIVNVNVNIDGESLGQRPLKCESKMAELNQLLNSIMNPLSFMCQTLGLSSAKTDREALDRYLVEEYKKSTPSSGIYIFDVENDNNCRTKSEDELPTLLHWGAKYGLQELCSVLLDCPKAAQACQLKNSQGLTAADIAESNGFSCLAGMIENYMSLTETAELYMYMKNISDTMQPVEYENDGAKSHSNCDNKINNTTLELQPSSTSTVSQAVGRGNKFSRENKENVNRLIGSQIDFLRDKQMYSQSQQELIQLFDDFKRDVYTISEVELLCQNLQLSHRTRSFSEKQEQLKRLRQQYELAYKNNQQGYKKVTAFEKLCQKFKKTTKKEAQISCPIIKVNPSYVKPPTDTEANVNSLGESTRCGLFTLPQVRPKSRPQSSCSSGSRNSSLSDRSSTMSGISSSSASDGANLYDIDEDEPVYNPYNNSKNMPQRVAQNMQYFTGDVPTKNLPTKLRSASQPCPTRCSPHSPLVSSISAPDYKYRKKPKPPPRPPASLQSSKFTDNRMTHNAVEIDDVNCPLEPPPLPPSVDGDELNNDDGSQSGNYLPMGKRKPLMPPGYFHNNFKDTSSVIADEPDYYNLPALSKCVQNDYIEMQSNNTSQTLNIDNIASHYMNVNPDNYYDNRCDSVPDEPPPAVPTEMPHFSHGNRPTVPSRFK